MSEPPVVPSTVSELHEVLIDEVDALRGEMVAVGESAVEQAMAAEEVVHEQLISTAEKSSKALREVSQTVAALDQRVAHLESTWESDVEVLEEWVDGWLIPTFALELVLRDWKDNPGMVSELKAAKIGHAHMASSTAGGFDPMVWHSYLSSMIGRMEPLRERYNTRAKNQRSGLTDRLAGR